MRIDNANLNPAVQKLVQQSAATDKTEGDFGNMLMDALKEVNKSQGESREMQNQLMAGQPVDVDDLMITMERASINMQLTMQVRNKVLEAYQEIMRTQI
jgi:flagellar hook-basal body complex protein FliE